MIQDEHVCLDDSFFVYDISILLRLKILFLDWSASC